MILLAAKVKEKIVIVNANIYICENVCFKLLTEKEYMCYKVDSYGLVIGLIDNQSEIPSEELFKEEFQSRIFGGYKKGVNAYLRESEKLADFLYNPKGYHLFGDCNMAILSVIDDFAFPNRVLHAGHGYSDIKDKTKNKETNPDKYSDPKYTLQVISGISTLGTGNEKSLSVIADETFLNVKEDNPYCFIGITNYKINTGLLLGNYIELLEQIKCRIRTIHNDDFKDVEFICLDCFSNHELTVIYFSHSLLRIESFINTTRTIRLIELAQSVEQMAKASLMYAYLTTDKPDTDVNQIINSVKDAHVFSTTYSYLGYDMFLDMPDDEITIQSHWDLKPGHFHPFVDAFKSVLGIELEEKDITPSLDMIHHKQTKLFNGHKSDWKKLAASSEIRLCVRRWRIYVVFEDVKIDSPSNLDENHPSITLKWQKSAFKKEDLISLRSKLDSYRVSKVMKERTLKMYEIYNDGITDPLFFSYFIELRGYLEGLKKQIIGLEHNRVSQEDFHIWLNGVITNFEKAYQNRFHQSSRMKNISDFNLEYNGGIQQLISAYDMAYKTLSEVYTCEYKQNLVYVSGYERVSSDRNSLCINIFHITYPELFVSTIWKEMANFFLESKDRKTDGSLESRNILFNEQFVTNPDYPLILLSRIKAHKYFNSSSYVHQLLVSSINENFLHYLLADMISFFYGYALNFELYHYWYWKYLAQMSHFYDYKGDMSPDVFIKLFIRLEFVRQLNPEKYSQGAGYSPFDPTLAELCFLYARDVSSFARIMHDELGRSDFKGYCYSVFGSLVCKEMKVTPPAEIQDAKKAEMWLKKLVAEWAEPTRDKKMEFVERLKRGEICADSENKYSVTFVRQLFYAYLEAVKELDLKEDKALKILQRDEEGKVIREDEYTQIVSDPLGGMFTCSRDVRIEYQKYRSVLYKSLWGACLYIKKNYIEMKQEKKREEAGNK